MSIGASIPHELRDIGLVSAALVLAACAPDAPGGEAGLAGTWESDPVVLDRGEFTETYRFSVAVADDASTGVMDLVYAVTDRPETTRTIRQDVSVTTDGSGIVMTGAGPRLVSGPEIVGVYEPDVLYCGAPAAEEAGALDCGWGSAAHGEAPRVRLRRRAP